MTQTGTLWTAGSLLDAIQASEHSGGLTVSHAPGSDVLEVAVEAAGNFVLHVAVGDAQILTSAILWPRDEQDDPEAFEAMMLRTHKALLPLCALSIDVIDGRQHYELFGAISRSASIDEIVEELSLIAESALELARDVGPRANKENAS